MNKYLKYLIAAYGIIGGSLCYGASPDDRANNESPLYEGLPSETGPRIFWDWLKLSVKNPLTVEDTIAPQGLRSYIKNKAADPKALTKYDELQIKKSFNAYVDSIKDLGIEIDGIVYRDVDTPPYFENINGHFAKHFRYPKNVWKTERSRSAVIHGIVRKDGSMVGIEVVSTDNPELASELKHVAEMIRWKPGKNGKIWKNEPISENLNAFRSFYVDLTPAKSGSTIPYGLEDIVEKAKKGLKAIGGKDLTLESSEITTNISGFKECTEFFPEYTDVSIPYIGILSSQGNFTNAIATLDTCQWAYNPYRYVMDDLNSRPTFVDYNGKTELLLSLIRLIQYCKYGIDTNLAFADVDDLIGRRIIDSDLNGQVPDKYISRQRIQQMRRDMVMEFSKGQAGLDREAPVYQKITRDYSIDELSRGLAYWSERGMIDNAAVGQLSALIDSEYDLMRKGKGVTGKDRLNLFGIKALAVWLQDGEGGMRDFIAGVKGGDASKLLVKYLDKLQKRYDENAPAMADREGVIEALACLVPPQGTDEAGCKAFYERRRAAEKVFPIKWLAGK